MEECIDYDCFVVPVLDLLGAEGGDSHASRPSAESQPPIVINIEAPQGQLRTSTMSDNVETKSGFNKLARLSDDALIERGGAGVCEKTAVHVKTDPGSAAKNSEVSSTTSLSQAVASARADARERPSAPIEHDAWPSTFSSSCSAGIRTSAHEGAVSGGRATASSHASPVRSRGRASVREKYSLRSSFVKGNSDGECVIPSGHVKASSAAGHGSASKNKQQRVKEVPSKSELSPAPPAMPVTAAVTPATSDAVADAVATSACNNDCHRSPGKRAVRKPARFDDENVHDEHPPRTKKRKSEAPDRSTAAASREIPPGGSDSADNMTWCKECRKRLNPPEVVFFNGDPDGAVEEVIAILDSRLTSSLCQKDDLMQQPQFKITHFTVYDEHGHICPFDSGLIEADVALYISGNVKSICADDPGLRDSVAVTRAGPIVSWWTTGYDGGANVVVGLTTAYAEYVLMTPSAQYEPCINRMQEMMHLIKRILEKLIQSGGDASFDAVMHHLETSDGLPSGVGPFSLDTLHRYSQFVVDHVQAYDSAGDGDGEPLLLDSVFIYELMRITGAVIREAPRGRVLRSVGRKEVKKLKPRSVFVMPIVSKTLEEHSRYTDGSPKESGTFRKNRCGLCEACLASECKVCVCCRDMKKYGGPGTRKQCCVRRRCQQRHLLDSVVCAGTDSMDQEVSMLPGEPFARREFARRHGIKVDWTGDLLRTTAGKSFYPSCRIGSDVNLNLGDDVMVSSVRDKKRCVGRVTQLYADVKGEKWAHVIWFRRYEDTILGSFFASVNDELFSTAECDEVPLEAIRDVCRVAFRGSDDIHTDAAAFKGCVFFYRFHCHVTTCTFTEADAEGPKCLCSEQQKCDKVSASFPKKDGGCFFVKPSAISMPLNSKIRETTSEERSVEVQSCDEFTERYRKSLRPPDIENRSSPDPYRICWIPPENGGKRRRNTDSPVLVQPFYRDYEVHSSSRDNLLLYLSPTPFPVNLADVIAPCEVVYSIGGTLGTCFDTVKPPFYFSQCYDAEKHIYVAPTSEEQQIGLHLVSRFSQREVLESVDVYCGCGGLSLGLAQSGVAETVLALSDNEHHLETFAKNFPLAATPRSCPSMVLKDLHEGKLSEFKKNAIELVCGSPSFESVKSSEGPSQLATFLGFCEFFDPLFVVIVAERSAVKYRSGAGLALALKCLLDLGYQTSCSMLQDGCYGMPQRHRRLVIFGAKYGLAKLPAFPPATHAFDMPERHLSFAVEGRAYTSPLAATSAAPYPRTTLKDAIGDLTLGVGAGSKTGLSGFLKRACKPSDADCFKQLTPMAQARIELIPRACGSDWRDLPNREVQLSDGTTAYRLIYTHKCSSSPYGRQRGVCSCAEDSKAQCDPMHRQEDTLIPWSLVHTGHRSGQWSGVYGRLQWDGYLHGVVANPEPLNKQGPVIHPEENRVISVRECARVHGYPDDFVFVGRTHEKYKMIADSVPPLLALALGREIACVVSQVPSI